jgi:hypothetical protein
MRTWDDYMPDARVLLPECPDLVIRGAIRDSAIEFCEQSLCWQDTMDMPVMTSERDVPLNTDDDDILIVHPLWIGGEDINDLVEKTPKWLDRNVPNWRYETGTPKYYTIPARGSILWLAPHVETNTTYDMQVALKPGPDSTEGPDDLYNDYRAGVVAGAVASLSIIPGKPWSNPALAAVQLALFNEWVATASTRVARGNTRAPIRTRMSYRI